MWKMVNLLEDKTLYKQMRNHKYSIESDSTENLFHILVHKGVIYFALCDVSYSQLHAYNLLDGLQFEFFMYSLGKLKAANNPHARLLFEWELEKFIKYKGDIFTRLYLARNSGRTVVARTEYEYSRRDMQDEIEQDNDVLIMMDELKLYLNNEFVKLSELSKKMRGNV